MSKFIGYNSTVKYGTAGASPTTELKNCKDFKLTLERGTADATTRASGGFKSYIPALTEVTPSWTMLQDSSDADFAAIRAAFISGTPISLSANDGGYTYTFDIIISKFELDYADEDASSVSVEGKVNTDLRAPSFDSSGSSSSSSAGA